MVSVTILADSDSEHRDFGGVCNHFVDVPFMTDSEHLDRYLDKVGAGIQQLRRHKANSRRDHQSAQAFGIHNYDGGHNDNDSGRNQSAHAAGIHNYDGGHDNDSGRSQSAQAAGSGYDGGHNDSGRNQSARSARAWRKKFASRERP